MRFYKGIEEDGRELTGKDRDAFMVFDLDRIWSTER